MKTTLFIRNMPINFNRLLLLCKEKISFRLTRPDVVDKNEIFSLSACLSASFCREENPSSFESHLDIAYFFYSSFNNGVKQGVRR